MPLSSLGTVHSRVIVLAGADPGSDVVVAHNDAAVGVVHAVSLVDECELEVVAVVFDGVAGFVPEHARMIADVQAVIVFCHGEAVLRVVSAGKD